MSGKIATIAGTLKTSGFSGDGGPSTSAKLWYPHGITVDNKGTVYILDTYNHVLRKVDSLTGNISTVAGVPELPHSNQLQRLYYPRDIKIDSLGSIYIADGSHSIKKVDATTGDISRIAGTLGVRGASGDGALATSANLFSPAFIAIGGNDDIYIADTNNHAIRKLYDSVKLQGTPANADVGVHDINITLSDGTSTLEHNFQITVSNVDDIPSASNVSFIIDENTSKTFTVDDFHFEDTDIGDSLHSIFITSLPSAGRLTLNGVDVTLNQEITDVTNLKFTPVENDNGTPYTTFGFMVNDGDSNASFANTATINVIVVDDVPVVTPAPETIETDFELDDVEENDTSIVITFNKEDGTQDTKEVPQIDGKVISTTYASESVEFTIDNTSVSYNNNGTTEQSVTVEGELATVTVSRVPGAKVEFTQGGGVQTSVDVANDSNATNDTEIVVVATPEGTSQSTVTKDGVTSTTESTIVGTSTVIQDNGEVVIDTPQVVSDLGNKIITQTTLDTNGDVVINATRTLPDGTVEPVSVGNYAQGSEVKVQHVNGAVIVEIITVLGVKTITIRNRK